MFGSAVALLGITPSDFYSMTLDELQVCFDAFERMHGSDESSGPMTQDDLEDLEQLVSVQQRNKRINDLRESHGSECS